VTEEDAYLDKAISR